MTTTIAIPAKVERLVEAWDQFRVYATEFTSRLDALRDSINPRLRNEPYICGSAFFASDSYPNVREAMKNFIGGLVSIATEELAPAGAKISISRDDVAREFHIRDDENIFTEFQPLAVWEHLVANYGPNEAYRQAAKKLHSHVREFWERNKDGEIKRVSGRPVVSMSAYCESFCSTIYGYTTENSIREVCDGFVALLNWSGLADGAVPEAAAFLESMRRSKDVPQRAAITDHIHVVPYKSKIEFRLSERAFESLAIFIHEFDPRQNG
jgi:hypothetical protein